MLAKDREARRIFYEYLNFESEWFKLGMNIINEIAKKVKVYVE